MVECVGTFWNFGDSSGMSWNLANCGDIYLNSLKSADCDEMLL